MAARKAIRTVSSACWWLIKCAILCSSGLAVEAWLSNNLGDSEKASSLELERVLFYNGLNQVYLERSVNSTTKEVINCTVFSNRLVVAKKSQGGSLRSVTNEEYLPMLDTCESLNANAFKQRLRATRARSYASDDFRGLLGTYTYSNYPGTRWCGIGILAITKNELGRLMNVDKCCRTHHSCSESINEGQIKNGLHNWDIYPRRHCRCDQLLFRCLKNISSEDADLVGHMYFNILRIECFDYDYPRKCLTYDDYGFCQTHDKLVNTQAKARYQWFVNPSFKRVSSRKLATPQSLPPSQPTISSLH